MPTPADPAAFARSQRLAFDGHNLHIGSSSVVHAVDWLPWIDDHKLPAPRVARGSPATAPKGNCGRLDTRCRAGDVDDSADSTGPRSRGS